MEQWKKIGFVFRLLLIILTISTSSLLCITDSHADQSANVVIIGGSTLDTSNPCSYGGANTMDRSGGGCLPVTGPIGELGDFNFSAMSPANVNATNLAPFDTALLNVASSGMMCNTDTLSLQQKDDLIAWVAAGHKLIIYDSECSSSQTDYSWLPFPFTTNNPGAMGANGTLTVVEDNTLSTDSQDPDCSEGDPYCINVEHLGNNTDAVGDMNVMTTYDPNWYLDMSGTNINGVTGPVHVYASLPAGTDYGLIIYNGLDTDYLYYDDSQLRKIWVQELRQEFNPSELPKVYAVVGITLSSETATNNVGATHTVEAKLTDLNGVPQEGISVNFNIISGPNQGSSGTCSPNTDCTSDNTGTVRFTYTGFGGEGVDEIKACFVNSQEVQICSTVTEKWINQLVGGNIPEYDAVGQDDMNYFAQNIIYYQLITQRKPNLEANSNFVEGYYSANNSERFTTNAGQLQTSPCYPDEPIGVALTDAWNQGTYEWWIVLQEKPETDLNINIMDCVLKHNEFDLAYSAEQTGRYRADWGQLFFLPASNPQITVEANPGLYATAGFIAPMILDGRTMPGLTTVPLNGILYTSKAHFPEGIVVALPETGNLNGSGQMEYNLKQGDIIHVKVNIPPNTNTADVWYGPASVLIKYVGVIGTDFLAPETLVD